MDPINPGLFVVGCARSGTTLLQRILDSHPQLAVANDSHFILEPITDYQPLFPVKGLAIGEDPPLTPSMVQALKDYRTFERTRMPIESIDAAAARAQTWFGLIRGVYDELAAHRGKQFAGEKSGRYANVVPHLHAVFPGARFVHIVRDGRDVTLSTLQWVAKRSYRGPGQFALFAQQPLATCALWWADYVRNGRRDGRALGDGLYHELRYESLVAETEPTVRRLVTFLGLPFSDDMLRFHEGRTQEGDKLSSKKRWLPPTPGLRDWRTGMTPSDNALFELLAGEALAEFGYEVRGDPASTEIQDLAARCREAWAQELASGSGPGGESGD